MEFTRQTTVTAAAEQVWKILGDDFNDISEWSSFVVESNANPDLAPGGGRVCNVDGFGKSVETITKFDDQQRKLAFTFEGEKIPFFVRNVENSWSVEPNGDNQSVVQVDVEVTMLPVFQQLMGGMMGKMMGKRAETILSDLKYFAENGKAKA